MSIISVSALTIFSQSFTSVTQQNTAGLNANCINLVDTVTNNGISNPTEVFTFQYECISPIVNAGGLAFSVATSGNYVPTFSLSVSGTATIVSTSLSIVPAETSFVPGGGTVTYGTPHLLTSGTAISLSPGETISGGFGIRAAEGYVYSISVVVSSYGSVTISTSSITWNPQ